MGIIGAKAKSLTAFLGRIDWFENYLSTYPSPQYPFPIDQVKAAKALGIGCGADRNTVRCDQRASGNQRHLFGTPLPDKEQHAFVENL